MIANIDINSMHVPRTSQFLTYTIIVHAICDRPRENRPSSHMVMIAEIPVLKVLISVTSFCSC